MKTIRPVRSASWILGITGLSMLPGCTMDQAKTTLSSATTSVTKLAKRAAGSASELARSDSAKNLQSSASTLLKTALKQLDSLYQQSGGALSDLFGDPADKKKSYEKLVSSCPEAIDPIKNAADQTGISANYLLALARQESGCNSRARAKTTSAAGMFQFVEQTWLVAVKNDGARHGERSLAEAIVINNRGRARVRAGANRRSILDKRFDARFSALMAAELAKDNYRYLKRRRPKELSSTDLYMAHFLGAGGANTFLQEMDRNPGAIAATAFPSAAKYNKAVFYKRSGGQPRTLREVHRFFQRKIESI